MSQVTVKNEGSSKISSIRKYLLLLVPLIAIGGMFYPYLGLLMMPMMAGLLILSFFKGRYWCANICPRGSYLDFLVRTASGYGKAPSFLISKGFRYGFLALFFGVFLFRVSTVLLEFQGWIMLEKIGFIFATICLVTTIAATILGLVYSPRTWCSFCPMGTLQGEIHKKARKMSG
jgi:polyferredoxin